MSAAEDFDLIVLGGGAAGLTASAVATHLGAKTLMIEKDRLGGDCTWHGCVPSKALLSAAHAAHAIRSASAFGLEAEGIETDFSKVMRGVRDLRQEIYEEADAPEVYRTMGVNVEHGTAAFVDPHTVEVDGSHSYRARRIVIATGARPAVPPIHGLDAVPYLTSETLFELNEQPERLAILGAGPIGVEMAQAFRRLGSEVTVIDRLPRILKNDEEDLAGLLQSALEKEGVQFRLDVDVTHVDRNDGETVVHLDSGERIPADALLVATGRTPNVASLNLDAGGVAWSERGVQVDDRCRTSQPHIFGVGDVTGRFAFTHMSEHMAKTAVTNALLRVPKKIDAGAVPWVTYTDPELAHVGATHAELESTGRRFETYRFPYRKIDRAITDRATTGWINVHARPFDGKILGASILGVRAGDLISELALAMTQGIPLRKISDTIHPYPSYGLGVRRAADQWYVQCRSPFLIRLLQRVFRLRGPVLEYGPDDIL